MQIHKKIEQARLSAGLTQDEMAEKLGIKRSTYQYWEKITPSIDKIKKVAKALKLSEDYFFGEKDEKPIKNGDPPMTQDDTRELIKALREHNDTLKNQVQASLADLAAELRSNRELLVALINGTTARGETMMEFLEDLTQQKRGSLASKADKREINLQAKRLQKDK